MNYAFLEPFKASDFTIKRNDLPTKKKPLKQPKNGEEQESKADNPPSFQIPAVGYLHICNKLFVWRRKHKVTSEALDVMLMTYAYYADKGLGVTSWSIAMHCASAVHNVEREMQGCRKKLGTLSRRGLVMKLGKSSRGADLYCPTLRAIEELNEIFSQK